MAFLTHTGLFVADPVLGTGRVILSHPDVPHSLVLYCVADESGYLGQTDGWRKAEGRTNTGAIRVTGGTRAAIEQISATFYVSEGQIQLFDWLKRVQDSSAIPITVQDLIQKIVQIPGAIAPTWASGWPLNNEFGLPEGYQSYSAWIDTDQGYKTPSTGTLWWVLQFQALREV